MRKRRRRKRGRHKVERRIAQGVSLVGVRSGGGSRYDLNTLYLSTELSKDTF